MAWITEELREVTWCYVYCRKYLTDRKAYEICRQRSQACRTYMGTKKLINRENSIMKDKKITEMESEVKEEPKCKKIKEIT
jgi:hypothetical protein